MGTEEKWNAVDLVRDLNPGPEPKDIFVETTKFIRRFYL